MEPNDPFDPTNEANLVNMFNAQLLTIDAEIMRLEQLLLNAKRNRYAMVQNLRRAVVEGRGGTT